LGNILTVFPIHKSAPDGHTRVVLTVRRFPYQKNTAGLLFAAENSYFALQMRVGLCYNTKKIIVEPLKKQQKICVGYFSSCGAEGEALLT